MSCNNCNKSDKCFDNTTLSGCIELSNSVNGFTNLQDWIESVQNTAETNELIELDFGCLNTVQCEPINVGYTIQKVGNYYNIYFTFPINSTHIFNVIKENNIVAYNVINNGISIHKDFVETQLGVNININLNQSIDGSIKTYFKSIVVNNITTLNQSVFETQFDCVGTNKIKTTVQNALQLIINHICYLQL